MEAADADEEPQVIEEIEPEYPEEARAEGKPVTVLLRVLILKNGSVGEVHVTSGPRTLSQRRSRSRKTIHL